MEDLWKIRKRKGLSVTQLSAKAGVPARLIREYEAGRKEIRVSDLPRLARALYVEEWDINPRSTPPPSESDQRAPRRRAAADESGARKEKKKAAPSPVPARDGQKRHLLAMAERLGMDRAALEAQMGVSLDQLTRSEAKRQLTRLQQRIREEKPAPSGKKKRGYLPESVDEFELKYLQRQQEAGSALTFTLFNGQTFTGPIVGFGPYTITIRQAEDGAELTMNKLAIAYYRPVGG